MSGVKRFWVCIALIVGVSLSTAAVTWARDASLSISPSSATFLPGDTITYTVTMNNESGEQLTGVVYDFAVENDDVTVVNSTKPAGPQTIPVDGTISYTFDVQVPANFSPRWLNAEASMTASDGDELASDDVRINLFAPFISATKTATAEAPRSGAIAYTVTIRNNGFAPATGVTVTDTLPASLTNIIVSPNSGCTFNAGPKTVTCTPYDLAVNEEHAVTFAATVPGSATCNAVLTNNVAATSTNGNTATAKADTKVICPTPTPSPSTSPTPTATPSSSSSSSSGGSGGGGGGGGGGSEESKPASKTGKVLGAATANCSARTKDAKAKDFIPNKNVPTIVANLFQRAFGRRITPAESKKWKERARCDKPTEGKLFGAMLFQFQKTRGQVQGAKTTAASGRTAPKKVTVSSIFQSVYGRKPTMSELSYWRKAAVKKNTVTKLVNAMKSDKLKKIQH